jgi:hypothetical protein
MPHFPSHGHCLGEAQAKFPETWRAWLAVNGDQRGGHLEPAVGGVRNRPDWAHKRRRERAVAGDLPRLVTNREQGASVKWSAVRHDES